MIVRLSQGLLPRIRGRSSCNTFSSSSLLMSPKVERGLGIETSRVDIVGAEEKSQTRETAFEVLECQQKRPSVTERERGREEGADCERIQWQSTNSNSTREHRDEVSSSSRRCAYRVYTRVLLSEKRSAAVVPDDSNCTVFEDAVAAGS